MKKVSYYSILLAFLIFLNASCKKKKEKEPEEISAPTQTFNAAYVNGYLSKHLEYTAYTLDQDTFMLRSIYLSAGFSETLYPRDSAFYIAHNVNAGNVSINNISLEKSMSDSLTYYNYNDFDYTHENHILNAPERPSKWGITGSAQFPATEFSDNVIYPLYSGTKQLPDSIFIQRDNRIAITDYSGADKIEVSIQMPYSGFETNIKTIYPPQKFVDFKKSDFSEYTSNYAFNAIIKITLYKSNVQSVNGKILNFQTSVTLRIGGIAGGWD